MNENLAAIGYPLPEDIEKLKWYGDFDGCVGLIDQRLTEDIPETLRDKLRMERAQVLAMRRCYTVTPQEAVRVLTEKLRDFRPEELDTLRRQNVIDWIFVDGQIRYLDSFYENLVKIRGDIAARQFHPRGEESGKRSESVIRNEIIDAMKAHGTVTCRLKIHAKVQLFPSNEWMNSKIHIWIPYPLEKLQIHNLNLEETVPANGVIAPEDAAQRTICFTGDAETLQSAEITYSLENTMCYVDLDPEKAAPEQPHFDTGEQLPHIAFTPYLRALTAEIVGGEQNPIRIARKIYDFITTKVNYSYMRSYVSLPVIPEYCAARLRGDCGVQALTFITMCRIAGIPAKWQSGLYANENEAGSHDWAMFYVAPYGWRWADCSYGGAAWRAGNLDQWNFYFGNLDPYRVVLTREFQGAFDPATKYLRRDPYDNQCGEVETEDGPLPPALWEGGAETISAELYVGARPLASKP